MIVSSSCLLSFLEEKHLKIFHVKFYNVGNEENVLLALFLFLIYNNESSLSNALIELGEYYEENNNIEKLEERFLSHL